MREMDLIPAEYRRNRNAKRMLSHFAALFVILIIGQVAGKLYLNSKLTHVKDQISTLQEKQRSLDEKKQLIASLKNDRQAVKNQLAFVDMLQQGGGAEKIFLVFDRVMDMTVWLEDWKYEAANLSTEDNDQNQSMKVMIRGKALDQAALSSFIDRLMSQDEITDVRVLNSAMASGQNTTVNFNLEIL